jgi:SAM-dependent methyltransferase/uncharacterized protein YbaR (Trm112 family)
MLQTCLEASLLRCPTCRGVHEGQYHDQPLIHGQTFGGDDVGRLWDGFLLCAGCPARFPVVDGVPILAQDMQTYLQRMQGPVFGRRDLHPELSSWILSGFGDDLDPAWRRQMLAIYAQTLVADQAREPAVPCVTGLEAEIARTNAFLGERRRALLGESKASGAAPLVLDAGAGVGASSLDLAACGARVLALDHELGALQILSRLLRWGECEVPSWRHGGTDYVSATVARPDAKTAAVLPLAADALTPPLAADSVDFAFAYGLLDNVEQPLVLIRQLHALTRPGGTIALMTPYDWASRCTAREHRLGEGIRRGGNPDPAQALRDLLSGGFPRLAPGLRLEITFEQDDVAWILPRHRRNYHVFLCHYVEAKVLPPVG